MTKKQMAYEVIGNSKYFGLSQVEVDKKINRWSKEEMARIYNHFVEYPENANGLTMIILWR